MKEEQNASEHPGRIDSGNNGVQKYQHKFVIL
jgi:hypothetical protein